MRMDDLEEQDTEGPLPPAPRRTRVGRWKYQRFIKDYLRCIASIDDNVGRVLDFLDAEGLAEDTVVIYTSDQGFFLGDHGWFDKRFFYEEILTHAVLDPLSWRDPRGRCRRGDGAQHGLRPLFLDYAGLPAPPGMQGTSFARPARTEPRRTGARP